jgi:hypothetical protein
VLQSCGLGYLDPSSRAVMGTGQYGAMYGGTVIIITILCKTTDWNG